MKDPRIEQLMALAQGGGMPMGGQMSPNGGGILQALMAMGGGISGAPDPRMMQDAMAPSRQMASMDPRMMLDDNVPLSDEVPMSHRDMAEPSAGESYMDTLNYSPRSPGEGLRPMRARGGTEPPGPLPTTEEELERVHSEMDNMDTDYEWEGTEETGPTPNDIKYMKRYQTDGVLQDFEDHFGVTPDVNEPVDDEAPDDQA